MLHTVQRRGGFSDRNGIKVENTVIQYTEFDDRTKNAFINAIMFWYNIIIRDTPSSTKAKRYFFHYIMDEVYGEVVDDSMCSKQFWNIIKNTIWQDSYDAILTLIEAIVQFFCEYQNCEDIYQEFNKVFQREYIGYRFVGKYIVSITDENEIAAINEAGANLYTSVNEHISKAIVLLSDRTQPDYENSIKESISAVEAMCAIILDDNKVSLGAALKKLEKNGLNIHPTLNVAFEKLYGYTCNANGIRHAGDIGGATSTFEEAKFMLVSCSAFVNYLTAVSAKCNK